MFVIIVRMHSCVFVHDGTVISKCLCVCLCVCVCVLLGPYVCVVTETGTEGEREKETILFLLYSAHTTEVLYI